MRRLFDPGVLFLWPVLALLLLTGCGGSPDSAAAPPSNPELQVVVFATEAPAATPTTRPTAPPEPPTATPPPPTSVPQIEAEPTPTPTPERPENENPLTGLTVSDPSVLQRRPLHIRLGNDAGARPQVNLSLADLVYEELVEWWTTRLTAVYLAEAPEIVAPVRSSRLINTQLTIQYDAALINSGGSDPVRWQLSQLPIVNLDEYFHPKPYFYRDNEGWQRRLAVNAAEAHRYLEAQEMEAAVPLRGFVFDATPANGVPAESIYIDYPARDNKVLWLFDSDTGRYRRFNGGEPMIDFATGEQISVANVIVYYAPHYETDIVEDSTGATSVGIEINGEGRAQIFRDRTVIEGRWRTDGSQTPEFIDAEGRPIPLKPGNSWIQVVPLEYEILINEVPAD
ncbi:MAG: DUF3048 domain-containing protein [Anaerolineae bacterium]